MEQEPIMERWDQLLLLLGVHKDKLEQYCTISTLQWEIETLSDTIMALQQSQAATCLMSRRSCRNSICRSIRY